MLIMTVQYTKQHLATCLYVNGCIKVTIILFTHIHHKNVPLSETLLMSVQNVEHSHWQTLYTVFHKITTRYLIAHNLGKC